LISANSPITPNNEYALELKTVKRSLNE